MFEALYDRTRHFTSLSAPLFNHIMHFATLLGPLFNRIMHFTTLSGPLFNRITGVYFFRCRIGTEKTGCLSFHLSHSKHPRIVGIELFNLTGKQNKNLMILQVMGKREYGTSFPEIDRIDG